MAQAARLNLRMQKELKLLLSDPPPGATFPFLSADGDRSSSSLSTIHAQIEGPEGTVYAKGIFNITIQIPERYPFQPPSVTFATPIYHPNIDTGGRICLDILNLPPKGAWQPSLNISTVLTSIGLLLSEPNPDDGLMCEASKEYKYNRQAFDQKARSMTEKCAKPEVNGNISGCQVIQTCSNSSMVEVEGLEKDSKYEVDKCTVGHRKLYAISHKLSLESLGSTQKRDGNSRGNEVPDKFQNQMGAIGPKEDSNSKGKVDEYNISHEKLCGTRQKSLISLGQSKMRDGDNEDNAMQNHHPSLLNPPQSLSIAPSELSSVMQASDHHEQHQDKDSNLVNDSKNASPKKFCQFGQQLSMESFDTCQRNAVNNEKMPVTLQLSVSSHPKVLLKALPVPQAVNHNEVQPHGDVIDRVGNDFTNTNCKKLCSVGKKLSLGSLNSSQRQENDNKENVMPVQSLSPSQPCTLPSASSMSSVLSDADEPYGRRAGTCGINASQKKLHGIDWKQSLEPLSQLQGSNDDDCQLLRYSQNLSRAQSKLLPHPQDIRCNEEQLSGQYPDGKIVRGNKQQGMEELPISDNVIVLDSEDSEEESIVSLRPKLLVARKRLAEKRKAKM